VARILVVDNDALTLEVVTEALSLDDHMVMTASDGVAALTYLENATVELILLDLLIPRMGGVEFAQEYQRRAGTAAAPIVLMSASEPDHLEPAGVATGAAAVLRKPFDLDGLLATVRRVLDR
jgi:DNA-binding response OmpR family regulator